MVTTGYSGTSLHKKLGIKEGFTFKLVNAPDNYFDLFTEIPEKLLELNNPRVGKDFIHFFTKDSLEFEKVLPGLMKEIKQNGMIWVSWLKKASKVPTDMTEDVIRNYALAIGLVDVKVCAINKIWSGLKLVIPVKDRKPNNNGLGGTSTSKWI
jgi:hypothetical protein